MKQNMQDVYIILPGYNEEKHIKKVIEQIEKEGFNNIIFVDDGSLDKTLDEAQKTNAIILKHEINLGKGSAVKTGCDYATAKGANMMVLMDSDGQHDPKEIRKFIKAQEKKDIVFGYRKFDENMPLVSKIGNIGLTFITTILFGMKIKDTQSGYRSFTTNAYKKIRWHSRGYGMESEMIARASKHKLKCAEVEIKTIYHDKHKGTTPIDGIKILINMLRFKLFD